MKCGYKSTTIRANDTDVLVILIAFMPSFLQKDPSFKLILKSGTDGKDIFNINNICIKIGEQRCRGLLFFHAFTGCDYISSFYGIGKTRWFDAFIDDNTVNETFKDLSNSPTELSENQLQLIVSFVLKTYKSPQKKCSNTARLDSMTHHQSETFRVLPPSLGALREHAKRAAFVAGYLWGRAHHINPVLPEYSHWGWNYNSDGGLTPIWTAIVNDTAYKALKNL